MPSGVQLGRNVERFALCDPVLNIKKPASLAEVEKRFGVSY
jgi:hypothetical protein